MNINSFQTPKIFFHDFQQQREAGRFGKFRINRLFKPHNHNQIHTYICFLQPMAHGLHGFDGSSRIYLWSQLKSVSYVFSI